jgi:flagellar basal body-associated protein FliL
MIKILILSVIILSVAIASMAVYLFFKGKEFPKTKIGHNKKMRDKGIECAFSQDYKAYHQKNWKGPF